MTGAQTIRVTASLGIVLLTVSTVSGAPATKLQELINQHEAKMAQAHAAGKKRDELLEMNTLATLYRESGQAQ